MAVVDLKTLATIQDVPSIFRSRFRVFTAAVEAGDDEEGRVAGGLVGTGIHRERGTIARGLTRTPSRPGVSI